MSRAAAQIFRQQTLAGDRARIGKRSGKGVGEAGGHRDRGEPLCRVVRACDRAAALHAGSADAAKFRSAGGGLAARLAPRVSPRSRSIWSKARADCRCSALVVLGVGIARILGPTGGFLLAYPLVAFVAGWIYEQSSKRSSRRFGWAALSAVAAELVLFAGGLGWLAVLTHSVSLAVKFGLYWFVFAEVIKVLMAAGVAARWKQRFFAGLSSERCD